MNKKNQEIFFSWRRTLYIYLYYTLAAELKQIRKFKVKYTFLLFFIVLHISAKLLLPEKTTKCQQTLNINISGYINTIIIEL